MEVNQESNAVPFQRRSMARSEDQSSHNMEAIPESGGNLLEDNDTNCLIDNPLLHWSSDQIQHNIREFVERHGLQTEEPVLIKAAKLLQDPEDFSVADLTNGELAALKRERSNGFWQQPKLFRITIITLCVAAVVQGWNQTASNGKDNKSSSQVR